jgi:hypothetical protein
MTATVGIAMSDIPRRTPLKRGKPPQRKTRVKARNAKRGGSRFPKRRDPAYREWIRSLPCAARDALAPYLPTLSRCYGIIECTHVKSRGAGGDDFGNCIPLCTGHHRHQHDWGIMAFANYYKLDLAAIARNLGERYTPTEAAW